LQYGARQKTLHAIALAGALSLNPTFAANFGELPRNAGSFLKPSASSRREFWVALYSRFTADPMGEQ